MTQQGFFTKLENRGRIKISGPDAKDFLQGLITADINKLGQTVPLLYACLLTPNGKFLHDFFISLEGEAFVLDCEGGERAENLTKVLNVYKLRAQVTLESTPHTDIYAIINAPQLYGFADPRHPQMGSRSWSAPEALSEKAFEEWDRQRIKLLIPDGSRDMTPERATMLEFGIDQLNGVSYDKGCYLGQELTARMHYRGLTKKYLRTVTAPALPPLGTPLRTPEGKNVGEMCSSCGNIGLALIKKESAANILHTENGDTIIVLPPPSI